MQGQGLDGVRSFGSGICGTREQSEDSVGVSRDGVGTV